MSWPRPRMAMADGKIKNYLPSSMKHAQQEEDDGGDSDGSSYSSSGESSSSSGGDDEKEHAPIKHAQHHLNTSTADDDDDDNMSQEKTLVKKWTLHIPIGLGLCPWAAKSHNQGNLRYVTCSAETPQDVAVCVQHEIQRLVRTENHNHHFDDDGVPPPPWSTTLVVCPYVKEWNESFATFDRFVSHGVWDRFEQGDNDDTNIISSSEEITLVAFHPNFLRWHGLPDNITVGSVVQSHYGIIGKKSVETAPATIVETCNKAFGMRRVKVLFHDEETTDGTACNARRQEQYVPTDWISKHASYDHENEERTNKDTKSGSVASVPSQRGPALPDNAMHQAPYPTIHIIKNTDLASLSIRDISRVKRKNAHHMMKLGWDGVEKKLSLMSTYKS